MGHLVLPETLLDHLGPAVSAGRSILMYGPPGNGKSSISNGIRDSLGDQIYVPRAIEYAGQVITVYDPIVHTRAVEEAQDPTSLRRVTRYDKRYVCCERPTVITGGELSLDMLDLVYNPTARTYQAPLQLKSTGGIFIVDDLGRQKEPPQSIVNRWIVPLEESKDILALQSGEKFEVPFDTLVIFSTNFHPNEIFDQAALRRIFFKIKIDGPNQQDYLKIFAMVAQKRGMPLDEPSLVHLLKSKYPTIDNTYANYQPIFLIDQMISICEFEGIPYQMTPELIDRAWANMFVKDEHIVK
jgi:Mg-chelatase subunit ChlI